VARIGSAISQHLNSLNSRGAGETVGGNAPKEVATPVGKMVQTKTSCTMGGL